MRVWVSFWFVACGLAAAGCFQSLDVAASGGSQAPPSTRDSQGPSDPLVTPPIELEDGATTTDPCVSTSLQAMDLLRRACASCHGGESPGARQGQPPFDFVLDVARLTRATSATVKDPQTMDPMRFLVPGDPDRSRVYRRIALREMPPPDIIGLPPNPDRPTVSDVSVLRSWITSCLGAPSATTGAGDGQVDAGASAANPGEGGAGGAGAWANVDGGSGGADEAGPWSVADAAPHEAEVGAPQEGGGLATCASPFSATDCPSYGVGRIVSRNGHNYACVDVNCRTCATDVSCRPGAGGCPAVVWNDQGACR